MSPACAAADTVVSVSTIDNVVAAIAFDHIRTLAADDDIATFLAEKLVIASTTPGDICAVASLDDVVTVAALQNVTEFAADELVCASLAVELDACEGIGCVQHVIAAEQSGLELVGGFGEQFLKIAGAKLQTCQIVGEIATGIMCKAGDCAFHCASAGVPIETVS